MAMPKHEFFRDFLKFGGEIEVEVDVRGTSELELFMVGEDDGDVDVEGHGRAFELTGRFARVSKKAGDNMGDSWGRVPAVIEQGNATRLGTSQASGLRRAPRLGKVLFVMKWRVATDTIRGWY